LLALIEFTVRMLRVCVPINGFSRFFPTLWGRASNE
jgi:hypothetical protein